MGVGYTQGTSGRWGWDDRVWPFHFFVPSVDWLDHSKYFALPERQDFVVVGDLFRHYVCSEFLARTPEEVSVVAFLANERLELT